MSLGRNYWTCFNCGAGNKADAKRCRNCNARFIGNHSKNKKRKLKSLNRQ